MRDTNSEFDESETSITFHAQKKSSFARENTEYENVRRNYCKIMKTVPQVC
jgi:hypothetical protein